MLFSAFSPSNEAATAPRIAQPITLEVNTINLQASAGEKNTPKTKKVNWHVEEVTPGDNLSLIFKRAGLTDTHLYELMSANQEAKQLTQLHPGQNLHFHIENNQLIGLVHKKSPLDSITFTRSEAGFTQETIVLEPDIHTAYREATITNSLFLAGTAAGMEQNLIMELASIFGWDVDFALDIRKNDSFKVLYEEHFLNGNKLRNGPILAAEFTNQGKTFSAVRYTDTEGNSNYFTPTGKSMRKAFLRTPVDFARISSHFNLSRKHPILNTIRAHKGTDYAAPTGTPIKAAGDGRVSFVGTKGGYGRTIIIQHGQSYKTLYAHMSKYGRGMRKGTRVKQGQIIGYVGSSGLATGPHLHYEFHLNGVVRNPVRVPLPKAASVPADQLSTFKTQTRPIVAKLQEYGSQDKQIQLADNSDNDLSQPTP
ncbi:MAG: peptidoglycan DD-metalloendopeptidase family protein [Cellvibrionaceae bacterium]|nr:peptidoglycan DD-metalloendopeptidase family protein [Cellvibrionaceae bacterium]